MSLFFKNYIKNFSKILISNFKKLDKNLIKCSVLFKNCRLNGGKIMFLGNGGSAAIASHISVDLSKNAKIRSVNFNEADLITCLANDYGHNNWMSEALNIYCDKNDIVVLISSSGKSSNIVNAAKWCIKNNIKLITFSGNRSHNPLNKVNKKGLNFWINSKSYNYIESVHLFLLMSITDSIIGKSVYKA
jgi:D-sedoheptulose 7-phosphate isomerase